MKQEADLAQVPLGPDVGGFYSNAIPVPTPACGFAAVIVKGRNRTDARLGLTARFAVHLGPGRIDPADIAVRPAVNDVHPA